MARQTIPSAQRVRNKARNLDWGPREFGSRKASEEGSIMSIAQKEIITIHKEDSIKHAADKMAQHKIRRLFVTDPSKNLFGVLTADDILDFLGGKDKHRIVTERHKGNLLAAMNEPVRLIMNEKVTSLTVKDSVEDALVKLVETGYGGIPVLREKKVVGVITERDFAILLAKFLSDKEVKDFMTKDVIFGSCGMQVSDVAKVMSRNGFRRLPILKARELAGIITSRDIIVGFSSNPRPEFLDTRIDTIMQEPITITADALLVDAAEKMSENDIGGMPVVSGRKVIGIITERDLIKVIGK